MVYFITYLTILPKLWIDLKEVSADVIGFADDQVILIV
jgi:hypothetical protein